MAKWSQTNSSCLPVVVNKLSPVYFVAAELQLSDEESDTGAGHFLLADTNSSLLVKRRGWKWPCSDSNRVVKGPVPQPCPLHITMCVYSKVQHIMSEVSTSSTSYLILLLWFLFTVHPGRWNSTIHTYFPLTIRVISPGTWRLCPEAVDPSSHTSSGLTQTLRSYHFFLQ